MGSTKVTEVSANTEVLQAVLHGIQCVVAGLAGSAVAATGAVSTCLALGAQGSEPIGERLDLRAAAVGSSMVTHHGSATDAAQLTDASVRAGLQPGGSAYFGYTLALVGAGPRVALVGTTATSEDPAPGELSYEIRAVSDARRCRELWSGAVVLVARRSLTDGVAPVFRLSATQANPQQVCIRVRLSSSADRARTGPVLWRFEASSAG